MTRNEELKSLIELGKNGHFPLFHPSWIEEASVKKTPKKVDQKKIKEIAEKMSAHKNLDRKRTILLALSEEERNLFIQEFFHQVEMKLLEEKPLFQ